MNPSTAPEPVLSTESPSKWRVSNRHDNKTIFVVMLTSLVFAAIAGAAIGWLKPGLELSPAPEGEGFYINTIGTTPEFIGTMMIDIASTIIALWAAIWLWLRTKNRPLVLFWCIIIGVLVPMTCANLAGIVGQIHFPTPDNPDAIPAGVTVTIAAPVEVTLAGLALPAALAGCWYWLTVALFGDSPKVKHLLAEQDRAVSSLLPTATGSLQMAAPQCDPHGGEHDDGIHSTGDSTHIGGHADNDRHVRG